MALQGIETQAQEFGERVRKLREEKGMGRAELAERAGISRPYLWQLEDGRSRPSLDYTLRIARALGVTVAQLIGEEGLKPRLAAVREWEGISEARQPDGLLKFFWTVLCARASAAQSAYRYERDLPLNGEYRTTLNFFDKVFSGEIENECAKLAMEAVKQEHSTRVNGGRLDRKVLEQTIEVWEDVERRAEQEEQIEATIAVKWNLGNALNARYDHSEALRRFEEVHALLLDRPTALSAEDIAGLYTTLGWASYYNSSWEKAARYFRDAIQKWETVSGEQSAVARCEGLAAAYRGLASSLHRIDRFQEAAEVFNEMLGAAKCLARMQGGNRLQLLWGAFRVGNFYKHIGHWQQSERYLTEANELWSTLVGEREEEEIERELWLVKTMILNNCADLLVRKGIYDKTVEEDLKKSLSIGERVDDKRAVAYSHWFLAGLYMNKDKRDWDKALLHLDLAEQQFLDMRIQSYVWSVQLSKARVYCGLNLREAAESLIEQIHTSRMESLSQQALVLATKAFVYARSQKWEEATEAFEKSIPQLEILPYEATTARLDYVEMLVAKGELDRAPKQLDLARQVADDLGARGLLKRAERLLQEISAKQAA